MRDWTPGTLVARADGGTRCVYEVLQAGETVVVCRRRLVSVYPPGPDGRPQERTLIGRRGEVRELKCPRLYHEVDL